MTWFRALLSYLAFLAALPFLLLHPKVRRGFRERLGLYPRTWPELGPGPRVWLHGASAGDVLALMPLVHELHRRSSSVQIVLTTMTNSGRAMAERERAHLAATAYVPYDLPGAVRRVLHHVRPHVLVLEYTELWPQLVRGAEREGVALVLHNGRISQARFRSYRWLFALFGNLLQPFALLLMRDEEDADRARALGASDGQVRVTGNTKFDNLGQAPPTAKVEELRAALGAQPATATTWVAGSTHEGEEELVLGVFAGLRQAHPSLRLVIAPRYTERAEKVAQLAARRGFSTRLRSAPGGAADVVVLDTIGELAACYHLADVVFVGGSFTPRGGQNILEPAACGKPVLFGPSMHNFADSVQVLLGRGGIQVSGPGQLAKVLADLLADPAHCAELGEMARAQVSRVRGAARRNAEAVGELLHRAQRQPTR
jgi:3-deoxy-D-manno-octulosonic-acid transferase